MAMVVGLMLTVLASWVPMELPFASAHIVLLDQDVTIPDVSYFGLTFYKTFVCISFPFYSDELNCYENKLQMSVAPFSFDGIFKGSVFTVNMSDSSLIGDAECGFNPITVLESDPDTHVYTAEINYDTMVDTCGGVHNKGDQSYQFKFVLQNDADWLTLYDQVFLVKCALSTEMKPLQTVVVEVGGRTSLGDGDGTMQISNELSNIPTNEITAERRIIEGLHITPQPILTIGRPNYTENGVEVIEPITQSVKLGDIIVFTIENVNDTYYKAIRAEECVLQMDDTMEATLIQNGCPFSRFAWNLFQWDKTRRTNASVSFYLRLPANALTGHPRHLTLSCKVKLCSEETAGECAAEPHGCQNYTGKFLSQQQSVANYGRKKRQVDENVDDDDEMTASEEPTAYAVVKQTLSITYDSNDGHEFLTIDQLYQRARGKSSGGNSWTCNINFNYYSVILIGAIYFAMF